MWKGGFKCLFVCPSVANRACLRLVWKLPNRSTWKFTTMLGLWKSIAGCSIMTSSQIQDGGRSLRVRKCLCRHISVKNDSIMTTETLIKWFGQNSNIFKFKMADGRHIKTLVFSNNSVANCPQADAMSRTSYKEAECEEWVATKITLRRWKWKVRYNVTLLWLNAMRHRYHNICKKITSLKFIVRTMWWYHSTKTAKIFLGNPRWGYAWGVHKLPPA